VPGRVNGFSLAYTALGAVVTWSGIKGWTISQTFKSLLGGTTPAGTSEPISDTLSSTGTAAAADVPAGSASYTGSALQQLWTSNGGSKDTAAMAEAVAMAESGGSATVTSANPDGGTNVGIFQLDTKGVGSGYTVAQLQNANLNTRITVMATSNGTNWSEWGDPVTNALPGHRYKPGSPVPAG
jgi:hypothetical protein